MSKKKILVILGIIILINLLITFRSLFRMRYIIIRKFNIKTEAEIKELNLTSEEKLTDLDYFYDCIVSSVPIDTLDGIEEHYKIDFVNRYEAYKELVLKAESDIEFFAAMNAIVEDVPTFHTDLVFPKYDYYSTLGCWNLFETISARHVYSKANYWNKLLLDSCTDFFETNPIELNYIYKADSGKYISSEDTILLKIDDMDVDLYSSKTLAWTVKYDSVNQKAYRTRMQFYEQPYSNALAKKRTITYQDRNGKIYEKDVYEDIVAGVLDMYANALGVNCSGKGSASVADQLVYSYYDSQNEITYVSINEIDPWALSDIPKILQDSPNKNVILDIRENRGGNFEYVKEYLYPYLFSEDLEVNYTWYLPDTKYTKKIVSNYHAYATLELKKTDYSAYNGYGEVQPYLESEQNIVLKGNSESERTYNVYVLISGNTASAADLLAGTLKDNKMATLIGSNTSGEGKMSSFLVDKLSKSGLLFIYMPELGINGDGTNNAVYGTAPDIYVRTSYPDEEAYELKDGDPYTYENRLKWDTVLQEAVEIIRANLSD